MRTIFLLFAGFKVSQWKEINSFLSHGHTDEGENHDQREHTNDLESHNQFEEENKRRNKRDSDLSWPRISNFFKVRNATKTEESGSLNANDNAVKKALYPGKKRHIKISLNVHATSRIPVNRTSLVKVTYY